METRTQRREDPLFVDGAAQVVLGVSDEEDVARGFGFTGVRLRARVFCRRRAGLLPVSQRMWVSPEQRRSDELILSLERLCLS